MEMLCKVLCLCLALALANGDDDHSAHAPTSEPDHHLPDRCDGVEFDAITPDEKGNTYFFQGDHLWMGYRGPAQLSNESFKELDDLHHIGHVDAAFRMHTEDNPEDHDHIYFFLDDHVFSYYNHTLEEGYPKDIKDEFPGVPTHLDSAAECPKPECASDSVLFFKGHDVYVYDIATKIVKTKTWSHLPVCTAALRWLEHYYCFHGHNFTRFHPVTGEVSGHYPKDTRDYFMRCPNFGHGHGHKDLKCDDVHLDAITTDDAGKKYLFTGDNYMRLDSKRDGLHAFLINRTWPELDHGVDAVFSHEDKHYFIKDNHVYIYKSGAQYILIDGYPKTLKEELGLEDYDSQVDNHIDAAFVCPDSHVVHVIRGNKHYDVDLTATPRVVLHEWPVPLNHVDAGTCGSDGVNLFDGPKYYHYENVEILTKSKIAPVPHVVTHDMLGCEDHL